MGNVCKSQHDASDDLEIKPKRRISRISHRRSAGDKRSSTINLQSLKDKIMNRYRNSNQFEDFEIVGELGKGGQADVFEIRLSSTAQQELHELDPSETFALKRIYKNNLLNRKESLELGRQIIMKGDSPFIVGGIFCYEDENYFYQMMQNAKGGSLYSFLKNETPKGLQFKKLGESGIRFIAAGIILGLEHLHSNNIIYCDLKTDNILIGQDGYPKLTDFEMSHQGKFTNSKGYRGTLHYVAPELFTDDIVDRAMDLWALGICLYSLVAGALPYDSEEIYHPSFSENCSINQNKYLIKKQEVSKELKNLILSLLKVNPKNRIGYCSYGQIKGHPFFHSFDWFKYSRKQIQSPLVEIVNSKSTIPTTHLPAIQRSKRKASADRETACDDLPQWNDLYFQDI